MSDTGNEKKIGIPDWGEKCNTGSSFCGLTAIPRKRGGRGTGEKVFLRMGF